MNAIRFHYFLHRDSLVCASIIVQKQPTILLLSQSHLNEQSQGSQPVVLGKILFQYTYVTFFY